jgi:hypothetical protein
VSEGKSVHKHSIRYRSGSEDFEEQVNDDSFRMLSVNNKSFVV